MDINKYYMDKDNKRRFNLTIKDECFENVEGIKLVGDNCRKCKYWREDVCFESEVVRRFDCKRQLDKLLFIYNIFTSTIVGYLTITIFQKLKYAFLTKLGILLGCIVILDIVFVFIESKVHKIYDDRFYKKLKKSKKKQERIEETKRKDEEKKRQKEEEEKIANTPYYRKILAAESMVEGIRMLSEKYDFGPNEEKINTCVKKTETIVKELKDNMEDSSYGSVIYLFEVYLPEFYSTLDFYSRFIKTNTVTEEHKIILTETVDNTLAFLERQRVKVIFDSETNEAQFKASANSLKHMLKEELK